MRLIDAELLKEKFSASINTGYNTFDRDAICECIDFTPTAEQNPWIPVMERLPEDFDSVLACDRDGYIDIAWGWYVEGKLKWNTGDDVNGNDIVAWMPLPEPYVESVEE